MENGYVESFNGRFRDECLNENWFSDLADAREKIAQWKTPGWLPRLRAAAGVPLYAFVHACAAAGTFFSVSKFSN
jgi:hypothetical protein